MKKTVACLLLFASSFALAAQVSVGFRGGLSFPKLVFEEDGLDITYNSFRGLAFAGIVEMKINDVFAIQPEFAFMQKGTAIEFDDAYFGIVEEVKFRINYLEIPVLAKVNFGNETIAAHILAGPSIGYALSGYILESGEKETFDEEDWDAFNRVEIGANIGGGIGLHLPTGKAFLDIRFQISLNNIADDDFGEEKVRNKGVILNVGYLANLQSK